MNITRIYTYLDNDIEVTFEDDVTLKLSYKDYALYLELDPLFVNTDIGYKIKQDVTKPVIPGMGEVINFSFSMAMMFAAKHDRNVLMMLNELPNIIILCSNLIVGAADLAEMSDANLDTRRNTLINWFDALPTRNWDDLLKETGLIS